MTQITSIKLGVIVMCVATVPWSLAQRPRTATNGSNQAGVTASALAGHSGLSGNSTSVAQLGTNPPSRTITGANTNAGAHTPAAAATRANGSIIQPQFIPLPTPSPLTNNNALSPNFSTSGQSPSPVPSASVSPTPTTTPAQSL